MLEALNLVRNVNHSGILGRWPQDSWSIREGTQGLLLLDTLPWAEGRKVLIFPKESSHWLSMGDMREPAECGLGFRGQFTPHSFHQGRTQVQLLGAFQKAFCLKHLKILLKELSAFW